MSLNLRLFRLTIAPAEAWILLMAWVFNIDVHRIDLDPDDATAMRHLRDVQERRID